MDEKQTSQDTSTQVTQTGTKDTLVSNVLPVQAPPPTPALSNDIPQDLFTINKIFDMMSKTKMMTDKELHDKFDQFCNYKHDDVTNDDDDNGEDKSKKAKSLCSDEECVTPSIKTKSIEDKDYDNDDEEEKEAITNDKKLMKWNVFVSNLRETVDERVLLSVFVPFGKVLSTKICRDKDSGKSKGFGFVLFEEQNDAVDAIQKLNEIPLHGECLKVTKFDENYRSRARPSRTAIPCTSEASLSPSTNSATGATNGTNTANTPISSQSIFTNVYVKYIPSNVSEEECKKTFIKLVKDELKTQAEEESNDSAFEEEIVSITNSAFWYKSGVGVSGCFNFATHKQALTAVKVLHGLNLSSYYPKDKHHVETIYIGNANDNGGTLYAQRSTKKSKEYNGKYKMFKFNHHHKLNPDAVPYPQVMNSGFRPGGDATSVATHINNMNSIGSISSIVVNNDESNDTINNSAPLNESSANSVTDDTNSGGNGGQLATKEEKQSSNGLQNVANNGNISMKNSAFDYGSINKVMTNPMDGISGINGINDSIGVNNAFSGEINKTEWNRYNDMKQSAFNNNGVRQLRKTRKIAKVAPGVYVEQLKLLCQMNDFNQAKYEFRGTLDGNILRHECKCTVEIKMDDINDIIRLKTCENSSKKRIAKARAAYKMIEKIDEFFNIRPSMNNSSNIRRTSERSDMKNLFRSSSYAPNIGNIRRNARTPSAMKRRRRRSYDNTYKGGNWRRNGRNRNNRSRSRNGGGNGGYRRVASVGGVKYKRYGRSKTPNFGKRKSVGVSNFSKLSFGEMERQRIISNKLHPLVSVLEPKYANEITNVLIEMNRDVLLDVMKDMKKLEKMVKRTKYMINRNNNRF